jgi:hypothetical protein
MFVLRGLFFFGVCLFSLVQCSTAPYTDALSTLNKGLSTSQSNLVSLDSRYKLASAVVFIGGTSKLTIDNCRPPFALKGAPVKGTSKITKCTLSADGAPSKSWETSKIPNGLLAMQALVDYGQGLSTLVDAKDVTTFNSGLKTIDSAVSGAAKAAGTTVPTGLTQYESLATFFLSQIAEAQRVAAVRDIITQYATTIDSAIVVLEEEARRLQPIVLEAESGILSRWASAANNSSGAARTLYQYDVVSHQVDLQMLANTDATQSFIQLRKAHASLVAAASDPQFSMAAAAQALFDFASDADALYSALHPATSSSTKTTSK